MLSRTADHLFWMARYMERAENTARMLNVSYEMSLLPQSVAMAEQGWRGLLSISPAGQVSVLTDHVGDEQRGACPGLHAQLAVPGREQPPVPRTAIEPLTG